MAERLLGWTMVGLVSSTALNIYVTGDTDHLFHGMVAAAIVSLVYLFWLMVRP